MLNDIPQAPGPIHNSCVISYISTSPTQGSPQKSQLTTSISTTLAPLQTTSSRKSSKIAPCPPCFCLLFLVALFVRMHLYPAFSIFCDDLSLPSLSNPTIHSRAQGIQSHFRRKSCEISNPCQPVFPQVQLDSLLLEPKLSPF